MQDKKTPKEIIGALVKKGIRKSCIAAFCGIDQGTVTKLAQGSILTCADSAKQRRLEKLLKEYEHFPDCLFNDGIIAGVTIERAFLQNLYEEMRLHSGLDANHIAGHVASKIMEKYPALESKRNNVLPWAKKFIAKLEKDGLINRDGAMWLAA